MKRCSYSGCDNMVELSNLCKKHYWKLWYIKHKDERKNKHKEEKYKEWQRNWRKKNKERLRILQKKSNLKINYGISLNEYDDMVARQKSLCAICGRHVSTFKKLLGVDHEHKTGKIRELLCYGCNTVIGACNEDIGVLKRAIKYLRKWSK